MEAAITQVFVAASSSSLSLAEAADPTSTYSNQLEVPKLNNSGGSSSEASPHTLTDLLQLPLVATSFQHSQNRDTFLPHSITTKTTASSGAAANHGVGTSTASACASGSKKPGFEELRAQMLAARKLELERKQLARHKRSEGGGGANKANSPTSPVTLIPPHSSTSLEQFRSISTTRKGAEATKSSQAQQLTLPDWLFEQLGKVETAPAEEAVAKPGRDEKPVQLALF